MQKLANESDALICKQHFTIVVGGSSSVVVVVVPTLFTDR